MVSPTSPENIVSTQSTTQLQSSDKVKIVLITSLAGLIIGISILAIGASLLGVFCSQLPIAFHLLMGSVLFGMVLLLILGCVCSRALFKLLQLHGYEDTEDTNALYFQRIILEKEEALKELNKVLDEKNEELGKALASNQVLVNEKMGMESTVNRLNSELMKCQRNYNNQETASKMIIIKMRERYNELLSETIILKQSLDIEKERNNSLQSQLQIVMNDLELKVGIVQSQEEEMAQLSEREKNLREEIAGLQRYISDSLDKK
ncbi:hypothetical protein BOKEGFJH_00559 [Chlamydia avium]|nr:hypothetical protein [Chlamydia avium]EPP36968.1 hypothetical protein CP10743SC13_0909 [Chlamydia psittaci 10_743_SC13]VVT43030.1 hypothetical protein BOKEGFJH_00559 [Chlamydia avium]